MATISISNLLNVRSGIPFTVSGVLVGYSTTPLLEFADSAVVLPVTGLHETAGTDTSVSLAWDPELPVMWLLLPSGSSVTTTSFSFQHSALLQGTHTISITDGIVESSLTFTVGSAVVVESAQGTLIEHPTDPAIIDSSGTTWALTSAGKVAINGIPDVRTGSVVLLYYFNHMVYQQNTVGNWWYTASHTDRWHSVGSLGPLITHFTVQAQLTRLRSLIATKSSAAALISQIVTNVDKLNP